MLHPVSMNLQGNHSLDEHKLKELSKSLDIDQNNIARVIADTTGISRDDVMQQMHTRTTLNPDDAKQSGLIHEIRSELFPAGADFFAIGEYSQSVAQAMPFPFPGVMPSQNYFSYFSNGFNYSSIYNNGIAYTDSTDAGRYYVK